MCLQKKKKLDHSQYGPEEGASWYINESFVWRWCTMAQAEQSDLLSHSSVHFKRGKHTCINKKLTCGEQDTDIRILQMCLCL